MKTIGMKRGKTDEMEEREEEINVNRALSEDEEEDLYTESTGKKEKKKKKTPIKKVLTEKLPFVEARNHNDEVNIR